MAGMLHGRVIHPPVVGARLMSVDEASIRAIPDVRVVRIESFLGVVAKDEWAAIRAARELKAVWSEGQTLPGSDGLIGETIRAQQNDSHAVHQPVGQRTRTGHRLQLFALLPVQLQRDLWSS